MAEGRILKRQISDSKKLGALNSDSPRLLYTWLIAFLDIEDRYTADPELIKGHLFPKCKDWNVKKIERCLEDLKDEELIILYKVNGERYLQFTKTLQKKYPEREAPSKIPPPQENSCERMKTPYKIKVKESNIKGNYIKSDNESEIKFEEFWKKWPPDRRSKKPYCLIKFKALWKKGDYDKFLKVTWGYFDFLKAQRIERNFDQTPMLTNTWLNNWEDESEKYMDFKYQPGL